MRNIYDQYSQPENRVTHSLVCSLSEDKKLLNRFVRWVTGKSPPKNIEIVEQRLPGESELIEVEVERRGLADAWIFDADSWSLIIESKISATLTINQPQRHYNTAIRRGFGNITVLAIDVMPPKQQLPEYVVFKKWSDIYCWLSGQIKNSDWALKTVRYLEIAETKLSEDKYLKDGTLTIFTGVPFRSLDEYNYFEAKRLLRLAMDELRVRKDVDRQIGIDMHNHGRGMITGKGRQGVWDFVRLKKAKSEKDFTKYPHLTFSIEQIKMFAAVTVPNGLKSSFRQNIKRLSKEEFHKLILLVTRNLIKATRGEKYASPIISVVQRRFPSQSAQPIVDSRLEFDLRTAFDINRNTRLKVKYQPQWLDVTYDAFTNKRSNLQLSVGAAFNYQYCKVQQTREILNYIANTWIACKPLIDVILKGKN